MSRTRTRRSKEPHSGGSERWLVSYADFITLLFAFFTVLYATSERNVKKQKEFESSVRQSFQAFIPNGTPAGPGDYTANGKNSTMVQPPLDMYQQKQTNSSFEDEIRLELMKRLGKSNFQHLIVSTHSENAGVRISLTGASLFSTNSSKLSAQSLEQLNVLADILANSGKRLVVEDHTDLSSSRAATLVRYLITKKVPADRLSAVSYADQKPTNNIDIVIQTRDP